MPKPPGIIDKINYVIKYVENPCDAPWTIYFETIGPALGEAIIALLSFGMGDVFRGYFRPRNLRSFRHGRKGKKGRFRGKGIPEIGNALGKKLPGATVASGLSFHQGVKNIWLIDLGLQRVLWWWLVADITVDFFYHWTSLINQSEFCSRQNAVGMAHSGSGGAFLGLLQWTAILLPTQLWSRGAVSWNVSTGSIPAGKYQLALGLTVKNTGTGPEVFEIGIFFDPLGNNPIAKSGPQTIAVGEEMEFVASTEFNGPVTFTVLGKLNSGFASGIEGVITVIQIN